MKKTILLLFLSGFLLADCHKDNISKGVPSCVRKKIHDFSDNCLCNDAHVDEYDFDGGDVYLFEQSTCGADLTTAVYSESCVHVGDLGGFAGNTQINGKDFYANATLKRTVWHK